MYLPEFSSSKLVNGDLMHENVHLVPEKYCMTGKSIKNDCGMDILWNCNTEGERF